MKMIQQFPCELISWTNVKHLSHNLAIKIRNARFQPDVVVAIARGGYVPARLLCDYLNLTDLKSIRIAHYTAGAQKQQKAKLVDNLCRDLGGRKVLLVDDISDTGDTLELARDHLVECGAGPIHIAVLHHKKTSTVEPDYYAHHIIKWRWIIYPWAVTEDLTGFIDRMPHRPVDAGEAVMLLQKYCGLRIRQSLVEEILVTQD
jgi:hypoxanthine phosphoribosyltransferase